MKIWVDIINPSHALFFNSLLKEFKIDDFIITLRDRAETVKLSRMFGIDGKIIGRDSKDRVKKPIEMLRRTLLLYSKVENFDKSMSFENGMSIFISKMRQRDSILLCDNDLKYIQSKSVLQDFETKIKSFASSLIIPDSCYDSFSRHIDQNKILTYNGYKEDIYIADYRPDVYFKDKLPVDRYVVIRPEALGSFYVKQKKSLVPELLSLFAHEKINVVYLPRDKGDIDYAKGFNVIVPDTALNGLDLCYYSDAVLTGSGTLSREAACMGKTAVSFFPSQYLLSVDKKLIEEGRVFHSLDAREIVDYVLAYSNRDSSLNIERCQKVKNELMTKLCTALGSDQK